MSAGANFLSLVHNHSLFKRVRSSILPNMIAAVDDRPVAAE